VEILVGQASVASGCGTLNHLLDIFKKKHLVELYYVEGTEEKNCFVFSFLFSLLRD